MLKQTLFVFSVTLTLALSACMTPAADGLSKDDARAMAAKGDLVGDLCELQGWYDDGICDDFCLYADPDCGEQQATCFSDSDCGEGTVCNAEEICLSPCAPGQVCPTVCAGFCVEEPVDACDGTWADEFGTCRTANDGLAPDNCCSTGICGGIGGFSCDDDSWCDMEPLPPGAADWAGICLPRPQACIELLQPVCGVDGETYSNECFAHMAGAGVEHDGACESDTNRMCGGFANLPCGADQFCDYPVLPDGAQSDGSGVCKKIPDVCPQHIDPACGRDGVTYQNACKANQAGVDTLGMEFCQA